MRVRPDLVVDRGYWIADDRVYAFVSGGENTIGEVGYHGSQPVSRNSRVLAGNEGVCSFAVQTSAKEALRFVDYDWLPGSVRMVAECGGGEVRLVVTVAGRRLVVTGSILLPLPATLTVTFKSAALFSDVHGVRIWETGSPTATHAVYRFRDRVFLDEWMRREGPYGADFLIPEPLRRKIFRRRCRSGTATREDLLPEYRDAHVPIYDATGVVCIGGEGYVRTDGPEEITFRATPVNDKGDISPFVISFDDDCPQAENTAALEDQAAAVHGRHERIVLSSPELRLAEHPHVERFFATVPGLVDSCIIRDCGLPRANPGRYYWIWAWDAMVTAMAALRWGEAGLAGATAGFVDSHRDEDGRIPMRWTRALEALDSQERGSLDALLFSLVYATYLDTGDTGSLRTIYPRMISYLDAIKGQCNELGLFANIGFYPDLPLGFHRTETSAVAMEVGNFYTFCRTLENAAALLGDETTGRRVTAMANTIESTFLPTFWDEDRGFLVDSIDLVTGERNQSFPLFTLLFLHSPLGLSLVRPKLDSVGDFIARHLLTPAGMRLVPSWDKNATAETVTSAWYPHWDAYALKVLRRTGRREEIKRWLRNVEEVLGRLGYAPEYLKLDDLAEELSWRRHGAASNLNCVTGWYEALLGGLCGLECDPGGLTIIPLGLPLQSLALTGIRHRGTRWNLVVDHGGQFLESWRVDGEEIRGTTKVPSRFYDGGEHMIEVRYGMQEPGPRVLELVNAEILEIENGRHRLEMQIRALGRVDAVFSHPAAHGVFLDGEQMKEGHRTAGGGYLLRLNTAGDHTLRL